MEMPLGTNSYLAPLENWAYGGGFNPKGEVSSQPTRLIIFCGEGARYEYRKLFLC